MTLVFFSLTGAPRMLICYPCRLSPDVERNHKKEGVRNVERQASTLPVRHPPMMERYLLEDDRYKEFLVRPMGESSQQDKTEQQDLCKDAAIMTLEGAQQKK